MRSGQCDRDVKGFIDMDNRSIDEHFKRWCLSHRRKFGVQQHEGNDKNEERACHVPPALVNDGPPLMSSHRFLRTKFYHEAH